MPLQPLALDMTPGEPAEHSKLARLLHDLESRRDKGRADVEFLPIRGLAGEDAANKVGPLASQRTSGKHMTKRQTWQIRSPICCLASYATFPSLLRSPCCVSAG